MKSTISKIFITSIICVYVISTVGVSVFQHYCCGELEKTTLFTKTTSCCDDSDDDEIAKSDCCKNENVHIAFQKDFPFHTFIKSFNNNSVDLFYTHFIKNFNFKEIASSNGNLAYLKYEPPNLIQQKMVQVSVLKL